MRMPERIAVRFVTGMIVLTGSLPAHAADGFPSSEPAAVADDESGSTERATVKRAPVDSSQVARPTQTKSRLETAKNPPMQVVSVGFVDPVVYGIDPSLADVVSIALVAEVRKHQGLSVLSMQEVKAMLQQEGNRQMLGCAEDSCLGELAEALGFDEIVVTTMSEVDAGHVLQVKRLNQQEAKAIRGVTKRVEANGGEGLLAAVGPLVDELFPNHPLRAGVKRGVSPEVALSLNPPPISLGLWGSLAGTSIGLLAAASISAVAASVLQAAAQAQVDASITGPPADGRTVVTTLGAATVLTYGAYAAGIAGFGLAGATGALSFITNWRGYGTTE